jgi:hypothetical protein
LLSDIGINTNKKPIYRFACFASAAGSLLTGFFSAHKNEEQEAKMGQGRHFHFGTAPTEKGDKIVGNNRYRQHNR